jgi:hypothetical protein
MCRTGGRRCRGQSCTRANAAARARLYRGRQALDAARAAGDRQKMDRAAQRIHEARMAARPDLAGDVTPTPEQVAAERSAVSDHVGGTFMANNAYIANGYRVPPYTADDVEYVRHMAATVDALERAVNRHRLAAPVTVSRALPSMWAEQAYGPVGSGVGAEFTERRLTSTTFDEAPDHTKHGGSDGVTVVYDLPAGTRALSVNDFGVSADREERELLLGSHQVFRKVADGVVGGRRVIRMAAGGT